MRELEFHIEYLIRSKSWREVNIIFGRQISGCHFGEYANRFLLGCEDVFDSIRTRFSRVTF
jgi:hypothetical protein